MIVAQFQYEMPWAVAPDTRIEDAREQMKANRLRHLPVVDGDRVVGMISDHDILAEYARAKAWLRAPHPAAQRPPPVRETVGQIMTSPAHTTRRETPIADAISIMLENQISALPVVDLEGLAGIVTTTNLLWWYRDYAEHNPTHAGKTLVRDRMTRDLATAEPSTDARDVALLMSKRRVAHIPVVDGGRLVGIISERDLVRETGRMPGDWASAAAEGGPATETGPTPTDPSAAVTAADMMTGPPRTISPSETAGAAAGMMAEHKVGALPVTEHEALVGIISVTDMIRLVRQLADA